LSQQNINTNITATANFGGLVAQLRAVTSEMIKLQTSTLGLNKNLAAQVGVMNRQFDETMRSTGQFARHFVTLNSDVDKFGRSLESGRLKLNEYYKVWQGHAAKSSNLIRDLAKQQVMLENAVVQPLGRNAQGLMQYNVMVQQGLDATKHKTALARQEMAILNRVMQDGAGQLINWGKNTQWAGRQLTVGLTVPLVAFGAAASRAFKEADQELVRLTKVYGGLTATSSQELLKVRKDVAAVAKELASTMGSNFKDTISLAADIAATGKQGQELLDSTRQTTRLAVLGEVDRQEAMKATLSIQTAFGQNTKELAQSIDFLNAVENQTSTSLQDLVEAIPKAGPVVKALGGDVKDLALYLTAMREGGINASEGANALKSALASIINPTKVAKEMFSGFGIDLGGIVEKNAGNLTGTIMALKDSLDTLDPLNRARAIEQLFGKFQFARMNALFENLGKSGSQTLQVLDLMKASTQELSDISQRELSQMTESVSGKYKRALESVKADMAAIGEQFLKVGTFVLNVIDGIVKFIGNLPAPIKSVLGFLGGLTAIAGPIIMLTGVLGNFFGYIVKGIFALKNIGKGGTGFKLLTPELIAAAQAGELVEGSFYSDVKATNTFSDAVLTLATSFDRLKQSATAATIAASNSISTMAGSTVMAGGGRIVDKNNPLVGKPYSRDMVHLIPTGSKTAEQRASETIFSTVPGPKPVNQRISNAPQVYMTNDMPKIHGVTAINGVSTGIVAQEAAKWHSMTAALAMQSQEEIAVLKQEVGATGTVTASLAGSYKALLPEMTKITALAADETALIVKELQAGKITVDAAKARIFQLNAQIETMIAQTAQGVAAAQARTLNLTTVPLTSQPVVSATGKSNMKELFHKTETSSLVDKIARNLGVRTSGAGYSMHTTIPRRYNDGGSIEGFGPSKTTVTGPSSISYDDRMGSVPVGGYVLNQRASLDPRNAPLVEAAASTYGKNAGGNITALLTPKETVYGPGIHDNPELFKAVDAANNGIPLPQHAAGGGISLSRANYGVFNPAVAGRIISRIFRQNPKLSREMLLGRNISMSGAEARAYQESVFGSALRSSSRALTRDYYFVGNWGGRLRSSVNSALAHGAARKADIVADLMYGSSQAALPSLTRFLKVNKISDDRIQEITDRARENIIRKLPDGRRIGEAEWSRAQHSEYLSIAKELKLKKEYFESLNIPGQRRAHSSDPVARGIQAETALNPYGTSDLNKLIEANDRFGTRYMGSYRNYGIEKINGEPTALAHMMPGYALGGLIKAGKLGYGRMFLGMPRGIKAVEQQRKARLTMEEINAGLSTSRFANLPPTNFGKLITPTSGRSFPVPGIGGVYEKPDGTRVFVKPVLDEVAALAEQRATIIAREAHGLNAPVQQIKTMIDPTDPAGRRKLLVLESPYDAAFAAKSSSFTKDEYFKQLVAANLRGDKDLSADNLYGRTLADVGTAGVFKMASGKRAYEPEMISMSDQARINLLGVKGGAKKFFAESTLDIPKGMTAKQYHEAMIAEIDTVLPALKKTIKSFNLNEEESAVYEAMIRRLEAGRRVNWEEFHGIHSAVKISPSKALTPAALKKLKDEAELRIRQKGHAVSLSDNSFKSILNGFNGGGIIGNVFKGMAMRRVGAGFGPTGAPKPSMYEAAPWGVNSLSIQLAETLFAKTGLRKMTQKHLYDKFTAELAKEKPFGYIKGKDGSLQRALEPDSLDSVIRAAASNLMIDRTIKLSDIDRDILRKKYLNWDSKKDTPITADLKKLIFSIDGKRESGGPVDSNKSYLVGEKGPEIFTPNIAGRIIPNYQVGGIITSSKYAYGNEAPIHADQIVNKAQADLWARSGNPAKRTAAASWLAAHRSTTPAVNGVPATAPTPIPRVIKPGPMSGAKFTTVGYGGVGTNAYGVTGSLPYAPGLTMWNGPINSLKNGFVNLGNVLKYSSQQGLIGLKLAASNMASGIKYMATETKKVGTVFMNSAKIVGGNIKQGAIGAKNYLGGWFGSPAAVKPWTAKEATIAQNFAANARYTTSNMVHPIQYLRNRNILSAITRTDKEGNYKFGSGAGGAMIGTVGGMMAGGYLGEKIGGQSGAMMGSMAGMMAGPMLMQKVGASIAARAAASAAASGVATAGFGATAAAAAGLVAPLVAVSATLYAGYKAWKHYKEGQRLNQVTFGLTAEAAKKAGLRYTDFGEKIRQTISDAKAMANANKMVYESMKDGGTPFKLTIKEYNALKKEIKATFSDQIDALNRQPSNKVPDAVRRIKEQLIAAGMSAEDATKKVYTMLMMSNKSSQSVTATTGNALFNRVKDPLSNAKYAAADFGNTVNAGEGPVEKELSLNTALMATETAINDLIAKRERLVAKDTSGKTKSLSYSEAEKIVIAQINQSKLAGVELTQDTIDQMAKSNPEIKKMINASDSVVSVWQKIRIQAKGFRGDLSSLDRDQTRIIAKAFNAVGTAVEAANKKGLLKTQYADLDKLKAKIDGYAKAIKGQSVSQQISDRDRIRALQKQIDANNKLAEARKKALEIAQEDANLARQIEKKKIEIQGAIASGNDYAAQQAQLDMEGLIKEQQYQSQINAIDKTTEAANGPLEAAIQAITNKQEKLGDKAALAAESLDKLKEKYDKQQAAITKFNDSVTSLTINAALAGKTLAEYVANGPGAKEAAGVVAAYQGATGKTVDKYKTVTTTELTSTGPKTTTSKVPVSPGANALSLINGNLATQANNALAQAIGGGATLADIVKALGGSLPGTKNGNTTFGNDAKVGTGKDVFAAYKDVLSKGQSQKLETAVGQYYEVFKWKEKFYATPSGPGNGTLIYNYDPVNKTVGKKAIKKAATGVMGGKGMFLVGEKGPELVHLQNRANIMPNDILNTLAAASPRYQFNKAQYSIKDGTTSGNSFVVNQTIYASEGMDVEALSNMIVRKAEVVIGQKAKLNVKMVGQGRTV
jgi:TP901 family phage tail tape measure protein